MALTAATAHADVFRLLDDPREAAQARVDVIQQAQREIDAVYFLARGDRVTLTALALLRDAARRGVTTRLVVDAAFQHIPKPFLAELRANGVEVRVYHPLTVRHPTWTYRRMHEKVVVVDGQRYITGGRNLAAAYFGLAKKNFADRDVYVDGPSAADAVDHFEQLWSSDEVAALHVRVRAGERRRAGEFLDSLLADLRAGGGFVSLDTGCDWSAGQESTPAVRFLNDPVDDSSPRVGVRVAELLGMARRSIVIESPYVVPTRSMLALLEKKAAEGVRVRIVTNSVHSTDGLLMYVAYLKYRRRLLRAGIELQEFKGPDTLHAKSMVIDGRIAVVGSYNLDPRSENLNAEAMCAAEGRAAAQALLASIDRDAANATTITSHPRPLHTFRVWTIQLLLPFIEGQL